MVNIVADIGGTNVRVAMSLADGQLASIEKYQTKNYSGLAEILQHYIAHFNLQDKHINACLAIACPTEQDLIAMTNLPWQFSQKQLKQDLGLNQLILINDYTAIAHAIPLLTEHQKVQVGQGQVANRNKPVSICGPGTGLGVANLVPINEQWHSLAGEGGHSDFAPVDETEIAILNCLLAKYSHVSYEQLLSGLGIEQIYTALAQINSGEQLTLAAQDITKKAVNGDCELSVQALKQFCKTLGSFAGNLALTFSSFGGVYIAGGIAPRFVEFIQQSDFRARFEDKGRLSSFNQTIPTFIITEPQPGLLGASAYIQQAVSEGV